MSGRCGSTSSILTTDEFISHAVLTVGRSKDSKLRRIGASVPINFAWFRPEQLFPALCASLGLLGGALLASILADSGFIWVDSG